MAAETESGFMIDDVLYPTPPLDTFTMDEAQVLYDYSGLTIEDFAPADDAEIGADGDYEFSAEQQQKMRNPGFMRAIMHVAYQRGNPRMNQAKVKARIGTVNVIAALEHLNAGDEDDALPPASTTEQTELSPSDSVESNGNSGSGSMTSLDGRVVPLATTTTHGSATSSTPSPLEGSAA